MSVYGYFTRTDLTRIGNIMLMGLFGVIVASAMNMFLHNSAVEQATTVIGVIAFVALVAADTQKLRDLANGEAEWNARRAIVGALTLYLDLVNLFILLLRLLGKRRNDW
jgi:FtsH-binding integral membrane protein